ESVCGIASKRTAVIVCVLLRYQYSVRIPRRRGRQSVRSPALTTGDRGPGRDGASVCVATYRITIEGSGGSANSSAADGRDYCLNAILQSSQTARLPSSPPPTTDPDFHVTVHTSIPDPPLIRRRRFHRFDGRREG